MAMLATAVFLAATVFGVPQACAPGSSGTAALVTVTGFKDRSGNLRVAVYPATDEDFLEPGRYVQRLDTPMTASGDMTVCAPVSSSGRYIVVALHDRDANGKMNPFKDGVGLSRNPRLGLSKPKIEVVQVELKGVTPIAIELNYMRGLQPRPLRETRNR